VGGKMKIKKGFKIYNEKYKIKGDYYTFSKELNPSWCCVYKIVDFSQLSNIDCNYVYTTKKEAQIALVEYLGRRVKEIEAYIEDIQDWLDIKEKKENER
jgi:hypothetical protein